MGIERKFGFVEGTELEARYLELDTVFILAGKTKHETEAEDQAFQGL